MANYLFRVESGYYAFLKIGLNNYKKESRLTQIISKEDKLGGLGGVALSKKRKYMIANLLIEGIKNLYYISNSASLGR